ncbi:MAG: hypothetical protein JJU36_14860 [Phycisphaeraceae bacterium]|nr:hypothetical protein [Phycisphaeraceae bacterium]
MPLLRTPRFGLRPLACLVLLVLVGCHPYPYFNYPRDEGGVAMTEPNTDLIAPIQIEALRGYLRRWPADEPFQLLLPTGTRPETYRRVMAKLGDFPVTAAPRGAVEDVPSIEIASVRARPGRPRVAFVEILSPADLNDPQGPRRKSTVTLHANAFESWRIQRIQLWAFEEPPITRLYVMPEEVDQADDLDEHEEMDSVDELEGETEDEPETSIHRASTVESAA